MSFHIIIKGKTGYGKSRAEQEGNLRKDGFIGLSDAHLEKAKWLEKRIGWKQFIPATVIGNTDMIDGSSSQEKE